MNYQLRQLNFKYKKWNYFVLINCLNVHLKIKYKIKGFKLKKTLLVDKE